MQLSLTSALRYFPDNFSKDINKSWYYFIMDTLPLNGWCISGLTAECLQKDTTVTPSINFITHPLKAKSLHLSLQCNAIQSHHIIKTNWILINGSNAKSAVKPLSCHTKLPNIIVCIGNPMNISYSIGRAAKTEELVFIKLLIWHLSLKKGCEFYQGWSEAWLIPV